MYAYASSGIVVSYYCRMIALKIEHRFILFILYDDTVWCHYPPHSYSQLCICRWMVERRFLLKPVSYVLMHGGIGLFDLADENCWKHVYDWATVHWVLTHCWMMTAWLKNVSLVSWTWQMDAREALGPIGTRHWICALQIVQVVLAAMAMNMTELWRIVMVKCKMVMLRTMHYHIGWRCIKS